MRIRTGCWRNYHQDNAGARSSWIIWELLAACQGCLICVRGYNREDQGGHRTVHDCQQLSLEQEYIHIRMRLRPVCLLWVLFQPLPFKGEISFAELARSGQFSRFVSRRILSFIWDVERVCHAGSCEIGRHAITTICQSVTSITKAAPVSPAAQPVNSPSPPPRSRNVSTNSAIDRKPVGPCGWPNMRLDPRMFIASSATPV